ncbi:MAG: hypothetical protein RSB48_02765 [Akkermansia sp.]
MPNCLRSFSIDCRYDISEVILTAGETPHVNVLQSAFGEHE